MLQLCKLFIPLLLTGYFLVFCISVYLNLFQLPRINNCMITASCAFLVHSLQYEFLGLGFWISQQLIYEFGEGPKRRTGFNKFASKISIHILNLALSRSQEILELIRRAHLTQQHWSCFMSLHDWENLWLVTLKCFTKTYKYI